MRRIFLPWLLGALAILAWPGAAAAQVPNSCSLPSICLNTDGAGVIDLMRGGQIQVELKPDKTINLMNGATFGTSIPFTTISLAQGSFKLTFAAGGTQTADRTLTWDALDASSTVKVSASTTLPIFSQIITFSGPTAARTVTLPNTNTTVPIATQQLTFTGPTAARTITLPDAATTVPTISQPLTITGPTAARSYVLADAAATILTDQTSDANLPGNPTTTTQSATEASTRLATTAYVTTGITNAIAAVNPAVAVEAATAAVLPNSPAYVNGVGGIGATLISTIFGALTVDGYTVAVADRVLVKTQASTFQNGVYTVTATGSAGAFYTLTRALDFDQPSDMNDTGAIPVINGTVNASTQWLLTSRIVTVGTSAATFTQFTYAPRSCSGQAALTGDVTNTVGSCPTTIATSVALAGNPTTTTQAANNNSTRIATTAYVDTAVTASTSATTPYTVTTANLQNSVTETAVLSFTVPANTWADGDVVAMMWTALAKNNSGGAVVTTAKVNVGAGAQVSVLAAGASDSWSDSATEGYNNGVPFVLVRNGSSVFVCTQSFFTASSATNKPTSTTGCTASNPANFTTDILVEFKYKFDTANALTYLKPQAARAWRQHN